MAGPGWDPALHLEGACLRGISREDTRVAVMDPMGPMGRWEIGTLKKSYTLVGGDWNMIFLFFQSVWNSMEFHHPN